MRSLLVGFEEPENVGHRSGTIVWRHQVRPRDMSRHLTATATKLESRRVLAALDNQRRDLDVREHIANVLSVGDDGSSISFDTEGEEDFSGDDIADVACVLLALDTPDRGISRVDNTRALDGTLDASWDDYEAFWNYHPNSGMSMTIFLAK